MREMVRKREREGERYREREKDREIGEREGWRLNKEREGEG